MAPHDDSSSTASEVAADETRLKVQESSNLIICTSKGGAVEQPHSPAALAGCVEQPSTSSMDPPASSLLVGILKQPRYSRSASPVTSKQEGSIDAPSSDDHEEDAQPAHWPTLRQSVHFINSNISSPSQSVVTAITYRPYTEPEEVSELYYTADDFDLFKREYRALLKAQRLRKRGIAMSAANEAKNDGGLLKNSSFWPSKVRGKSNDSSDGTFSQPSFSSRGSVFSSVFDVAKEAVSLFSGSPNYSYYQNQSSPQNKARQQQQLLVDTLYSNLF
jgi:hypothetical protein